jgi:hypothetical protein
MASESLCPDLNSLAKFRVTAADVWMLRLWKHNWMLHLSLGKLVFIIATFYGLVFSLDDLIGPERTNGWAASWLSRATRFFTDFIRRVFHSTMILRIVAMVSAMTIFAALCMLVGYCLLFIPLNSNADHFSAIRTILLLFFGLLSFGIVLLIGDRLQSRFQADAVASFLHDHSEYLEVRVVTRISAWIDWAIHEGERDSVRSTPTGLPATPYEVRTPVHGVLLFACVAATVTLCLSLLTRTVRLLVSAIVWLLVFAPPQALNAVAQRTGAKSYVKVGKYVALFVMSIYGLLHD